MVSPARIVAVVALALVLVVGANGLTSEWFGFVTTRGTSMQPAYREGDLVLFRRAGDYRVGDIVAYRDGTLGNEVILHRIVEIAGGRAVTQGDSNPSPDRHRPALDELEGRAIVHIPHVGRLVSTARPLLAAGAAALLVVALLTTTGSRRARPKPRTDAMPDRRVHNFRVLHVAARGSLLVGVALAGLAGSAFTRAPEVTTSTEQLYAHRGTFEYSAPSDAVDVYPDRSVDTGEPIFRRLVDRLTVDFAYRLAPVDDTAPVDATGTGHLEVEIGKGDWRRVLDVGASGDVGDGRLALRHTVDLDRLDRLITDFAAQTGETAMPYEVRVRPVVSVDGAVAGHPVLDEFSPELTLRVDELRVTVVVPEELRPMSAGTATTTGSTGQRLGLGPVDLPVDTARTVGLTGAAIAALLWAITSLAARHLTSSEAVRIRGAHASKVVSVSGVLAREQVVEVTSIDALLRLAEQYDRFILHSDNDGGDCFVVDDGSTTYRYRASA